MTHLNDYDRYDSAYLPPVVARYVETQADPAQRATLADLFAVGARVVDEGIEYAGVEEIRGWLEKSASVYTYTTTPLGQRSGDGGRWVVLVRLEGNFPGSVVDLRYQFVVVDGDRIGDLVIAI